MSRGQRQDAGFSLAEVMVALFVAVVGLMALGQLLSYATRAEALARNGAMAARLGQDKLDDLMKRNFDTDAAVQLTPLATDSLASNVAPYFDTPAPTVQRRWVVRQGPAGTRAVTMRVIVGSALASRTVDLTTLVRRW